MAVAPVIGLNKESDVVTYRKIGVAQRILILVPKADMSWGREFFIFHSGESLVFDVGDIIL